MQLKQVISEDKLTLDENLASQEFNTFVATKIQSHHKHLLLECTNLPPYKKALQQQTKLPVTDILTCIEKTTTRGH